MEKEIGSYKVPEPNLSDKIDRLTEMYEAGGPVSEKKPKKFKLPLSAKVGRAKLKMGYVTVIEIAENDAVSFNKQEIRDGTIKLKDTFHAVDDSDILSYKSKPLIIIPKKSNVPFNPNRVGNNTYGQKHIMSRMMNETLDSGKKAIGLAGMSIGAIVLIGALAYAFIAG